AGTNLYIAENDYYSHCYIRRLSAGTLSLYAGSGLCGYSPDGTAPTSAQIWPRDIAVGSEGDLFFPDACSVRKISAGALTTVATCASSTTLPSLAGWAPQHIAIVGVGDVWAGELEPCRVTHIASSSIVVVA